MTTPTSHLTHRPTYKGLVVPFVVDNDHNGRPVFSRQGENLPQCHLKELCSVCGERLDYWKWFITGGIGSDGYVYSLEAGLHLECLTYAVKHCPHLGNGDGRGGYWKTRGYSIVPFPANVRLVRLTKSTTRPGTPILRLRTPEEHALVTRPDGGRGFVRMTDVASVAHSQQQEPATIPMIPLPEVP